MVMAVSAQAGDIAVYPGVNTLARAIASANSGDRLLLAAGLYQGSVIVDRPLTILGELKSAKGEVKIDGQNQGSVITIDAPDASVSGLTITGSGNSHQEIDSGIKLTKKAINSKVKNNIILGNLYGVDIHGAKDALVEGNKIVGRTDQRMNDRGNGVYVWNAPGATVKNNHIRLGRDGIFVNTSKKNTFSGNRIEDLRFAIHYMYANHSEISGNVSIGNHLGYALMFSRDLVIRANKSINDRDHGIMLNYVNKAEIEGNLVQGGANKCLFMYNANKNSLRDNRFEGCQIGIHFTAGSDRNSISNNAFIGNKTQVKYVGTKNHEWSEDKKGNYWSDHSAFDANGDGLADQSYRPNDMMDQILWTQPTAKLLLGSPAIQLIRWAQKEFPALLPGGVVDTSPLMKPSPDTPAITSMELTPKEMNEADL